MNILRWLGYMSILYISCMYAYVNLSSEVFIFSVEGIYICILLIILRSLYVEILIHEVKYKELLKIYYEQVYIYTNILKKLNVKAGIIYGFFH